MYNIYLIQNNIYFVEYHKKVIIINAISNKLYYSCIIKKFGNRSLSSIYQLIINGFEQSSNVKLDISNSYGTLELIFMIWDLNQKHKITLILQNQIGWHHTNNMQNIYAYYISLILLNVNMTNLIKNIENNVLELMNININLMYKNINLIIINMMMDINYGWFKLIFTCCNHYSRFRREKRIIQNIPKCIQLSNITIYSFIPEKNKLNNKENVLISELL